MGNEQRSLAFWSKQPFSTIICDDYVEEKILNFNVKMQARNALELKKKEQFFNDCSFNLSNSDTSVQPGV